MSTSLQQANAWEAIKTAFPILGSSFQLPFPEVDDGTLMHTAKLIENMEVTDMLQSLIITKIEQHVRDVVVPKFWASFKNSSNRFESFKIFYNSIQFLYDYYKGHFSVIQRLCKMFKNSTTKLIYGQATHEDALQLIFRSTLLCQLPINSSRVIEDFYEVAYSIEYDDSYFQGKVCNVCLNNREGCHCLRRFDHINSTLLKLNLLEPLAGQILTSLTYSHIEQYVSKTCKDNFDTSFIEPLEEWLDTTVINWIRNIYHQNSVEEIDLDFVVCHQKLLNLLYNTYTKLRIEQLFNIIIEYPDSFAALEDLNKCLPKTDLRPVLTKKLQKAMETRLLHPGVSTPDILTAYVASIRSMRVLDPSGLLLETVTQPVHRYLRSREDTIRCVVSSLTEEGSNDLAEELVKGEAVHVDENILSEEETEGWETWLPDPVDVDPSKLINIRRSSDIISMLVNVYGSKELFVNEYRTLLADRLLSQFTCDTEKEIRYLELLKLRFGDSQLHYCEVMLKDVADSKRINQHIKQDPQYIENNFPMSAMIVSAQFWPPFKDEKLQLHENLVSQVDVFTRAFEALKGNRTLCWKNHLGLVDLEIQLSDRTLNLSVSPVHATILMHFQDKNEWQLDDLSRTMQVPPTVLRKKIGFWQSHGLLEEIQTDIFYLMEENKNNGELVNAETIVEDYETESAMASTQDQREEDLQTFWSYITGMLMNLDSLPLERIHQMLKMFAFQGPTVECSLQELRHFLDRKVREHELVYSGGLYRLPKSDGL